MSASASHVVAKQQLEASIEELDTLVHLEAHRLKHRSGSLRPTMIDNEPQGLCIIR
jgi:hypothetical protein